MHGPQVPGVRLELEVAIVDMLWLCPRGEWGMCGLNLSLRLRLGVGPEEVGQALAAMEQAGIIERASGALPFWRPR